MLEQITAALSSGDIALAERLAHTLKGVAGNIGARQVQSTAGALEKLIRAKAAAREIDSAKHQASAALDPLIARLKEALPAPAPETEAQTTVSVPANPAQPREAAAQLTRLLSEFDPGAADFIASNHSALRPLFADEEWLPFEQLVQDYSFAEARAQLEIAVKGIG